MCDAGALSRVWVILTRWRVSIKCQKCRMPENFTGALPRTEYAYSSIEGTYVYIFNPLATVFCIKGIGGGNVLKIRVQAVAIIGRLEQTWPLSHSKHWGDHAIGVNDTEQFVTPWLTVFTSQRIAWVTVVISRLMLYIDTFDGYESSVPNHTSVLLRIETSRLKHEIFQ